MYQQTAICSTLNNVPTTAATLQKSRLPFGIHLYPFGFDESIPVSSDEVIVRCKICRAYINPYVRICEQRWQCNLCNRLNELPASFIYDYANQRYYDLSTKPELSSETVEYVAKEEYMLRPPQPACYMFVFNCSRAATEIGFIPVMASAIADLLDDLPGDARTSVGFIACDSGVHYFSFSGSQVVHHVVTDVTTDLVPCSTDGILANISSKREMILNFLNTFLSTFPFEQNNRQCNDVRSALGPAIKSAVKILTPIGGKITIVQAQMPDHGSVDDGSILVKRENPKILDKSGEYLTPLINPASDFYKNLALECCEHQISVDLFNLSSSYVDLASIGPLIKISAGTMIHYSNSPGEQKMNLIRFDQDFRYHLLKPIGLESVLRLRHSKGLKIHTFHGNFFVRSTNLLVLPIANPDASFAFQMEIEDDLKPDNRFVFFQASLLHTTPMGERRIRVHTARYSTVTTLPEVIYGANQTAIVAMLAKMAVDRSMKASIGEAKEALIGAGVDLLSIYANIDEGRARSYAMSLPENLRLIPLYILALLKHIALRFSTTIRLDDRIMAMERFKTLPVDDLLVYIYPDLYFLQNIKNDVNEDWKVPIQLTAAHIERHGAYLLDSYDMMILYICESIDPGWCYDVFGVKDYRSIPEQTYTVHSESLTNHYRPRDPALFTSSKSNDPHGANSSSLIEPSEIISYLMETPLARLPELDNFTSNKLREFISCLMDNRAHKPKFYIMKESNPAKPLFIQYLIDDKSESNHSYSEFWRFLQDQAK